MFVRVFNRHFLLDFTKSFLLTVGVLAFVMYIGAIVKAIDLLSRGVSGLLVMKIFALNIPFTLSFVIPMSVLTTALLQFGRLSSDGEITAMKASGVSLPQIAAPFLVVGAALSAFCLYLNSEISPVSHYTRRTMTHDLGDENLIGLIDEATFTDDIPGMRVYVGKKDGNHLEDIILMQFENGKPKSEVFARSGDVSEPEGGILELQLEKVRLIEYDKDHPDDLGKTRTMEAESLPLRLDLSQLVQKKKRVNKKPSDMTTVELMDSMTHVRQAFPNSPEEMVGRMRAKLAVEGTQRLALALSCFSFMLIAVPLGMRSSRKDSSNGIWVALALFLVFYLFIILSDALVDYPEVRPELIPLVPVLLLQAIGAWLLWKNR